MEEECGNYDQGKAIIHMGLKLNPLNENLFIKAVKLEEKVQEGSHKVRDMIQNIKELHEDQLDRTWRLLLEGALFEGRLGNRDAARSLLQYLMNKCKN